MERNKYGKAVVAYGSSEQRELEIIDFVKARFKDNRVITIGHVEGGYICGVENPPSTGRSAQSTIWLTKESLLGLFSVCTLYFTITGEDMDKIIKESMDGDTIEYSLSDNLKPLEISNK